MANDSKLGLLAGVAAVLLIAVVYYQKGATGSADPTKSVINQAAGNPPPAVTPADPLLR